ncbi:centrosomal protein of 128 kDa-like isoform X1 [Erpetoichthys calabaricus]|uniref:centrosomal protein of 128 kDa-like isoform X1 n=2 Tax=Erpetoichthys calabaricus TaxID=27687 RepID=UPI0022348BE5|nr:centrosomal protein of 128 kDa-like isoform X1 [Erpetoichthys calabaricus]XP_028677324.2 centrosomal protein of 128 kDa-like isoform X1 [Erpetoichthys calabaricus]
MAESSSDSDTYSRNRWSHQGPSQTTHLGARQRSRINGAEDIAEKIDTLASTLQDTTRTLNNVDRMLGHYRDHTEDQTEAMSTLRENLEKSIRQLRSQRLHRSTAGRSASLSTLHTSDLEGATASESQIYRPTSPLRDYGELQGSRRRRSRSANVRFEDEVELSDQIHSLHQSFRDLSSDQVRLGDDIDREIVRRNRTDTETKKTLDDLSARIKDSDKQETVSERVERRLQQIEREMRTERQQVERRQDHFGLVSHQLQGALRKREAKLSETEDIMKGRLYKSESEKSQIEQELERTRRKLDQAEGGRGTLLQQIDDLRTQLSKTEKDRLDLQQQISQIALLQRSRHEDEESEKRFRAEHTSSEKRELEKQIQDLRLQLNQNIMISEVEELKRSLDRKEREKAQLLAHIEILSSDLEKREKQQLRMLDQLKEIQNLYENCEADRKRLELQVDELFSQLKDAGKESEKYLKLLKETELQKEESEKKKEELKIKAQESINQWKLKCKKAERELQKQKEAAEQMMDSNSRAAKDKEALQVQIQSVMTQADNFRKELGEVISKLAQKEEEIHRKDVVLNETKSQQMDLECEIRNIREVSSKLENEVEKQSLLHMQLKEENNNLESEIIVLRQEREKDQASLIQMQGMIKDLSAIRAELTLRLATEERSYKDLKKSLADLEGQQESSQNELISMTHQVQLERELHQRELSNLQSEIKNLKTKHEKSLQETVQLFRQERDELEKCLKKHKAETTEDKNLIKAHRRQLEKIKIECDKLTEELTHSEEGNSKLRRKYQLLKQELQEKEKHLSNGEDHANRMDEVIGKLKEQIFHKETEQESIIKTVGEEINSICEILAIHSDDKFKAVSLMSDIQKDPHRWLAEMKTKLRWLCEEVKEREGQGKKLKHHLQQIREQLKSLKQSKESDRQLLIEQITNQDRLLEEIHREKRDLLDKSRRKDDEIRTLNDRIMDLEMSTRLALDHLESVPEKLSLLEDFRDLEESQRQREMIEQRYAKYKEIVGSLQHHLEESKKRLEEYKDEKWNATSRSTRLATLSSSVRGRNSFLSSSFLTDDSLPHQQMTSVDSNIIQEQSHSIKKNSKFQAEKDDE